MRPARGGSALLAHILSRTVEAQAPYGLEHPCLVWQGHAHQGYARVKRRGRVPEVAARVVWELAHGAIPYGRFVLHRCDNGRCLQVHHLWLGTRGDNNRDAVAKGRKPKHYRWRNHYTPRGEDSVHAKLTEDAVKAIRSTTGRLADIAAKYGVTSVTIGDIKRRKTWKHVT